MSVKNQGPGNPESISIYLYPFYPFFYPAQRLGFLGVLIMYSSNYKTHLDVKTTPQKKQLKCIEVPTYVPPAHSSPFATHQLVQLLLPKVMLHSQVHSQHPGYRIKAQGTPSPFDSISIYFNILHIISILFNCVQSVFCYFMLFLFVYICFYMFLYSSVF